MLFLFKANGTLRTDVLLFRKSKILPYSEAGDLYDRFGQLLVKGTFLSLERNRRIYKDAAIMVIK